MMRLALDKSRAYQYAVGEETRNLFKGAQLATERQEREKDRELQKYQIDQTAKAQRDAAKAQGGGIGRQLLGGALSLGASALGGPGGGQLVGAGLKAFGLG
jgi:hypothetical protein